MDEEAAVVVKRIFDLYIEGNELMQIAKILTADKVLTIKAYYTKQKSKALPDNSYHWNENSVVGILEHMDYCGHTVNFKRYSKSYKLKKCIPTPKKQQAIFRSKSFNGSQDHYRCANYKSNTGSCTAHFVREKMLCQIVRTEDI